MIKNNNKFNFLDFLHSRIQASNFRHFSSAANLKFNEPAPVVSYSDSGTQKLAIYKENKNKCGVYM
jgi:hypothetical protein